MTTEKQRYANEVQANASNLDVVRSNIKEIVGTYYDLGYNDVGSNPILDGDILTIVNFDATDLAGYITVAQQLTNFFENTALTPADYGSNVNKIRLGTKSTKVPTEATEKQRYALEVLDSGKVLHLVRVALPKLIGTYFDLGFNVGGADPIVAGDITHVNYDAADLGSYVTLMQQLDNLFENSSVTAADYGATLNKMRLGQ